jgi:hypothetical protein
VDLQSPGAEFVGRILEDVSGAEHGASPVGEKHADIGIAAFGDAAEPTYVTARVLLGNDAEVAREAASRGESTKIPDETDDGGCGEKSDAGNGEEPLDLGKLFGECVELVLDVGALSLERLDLGAGLLEVRAERVREIRVRIFDELADRGHNELSALGDEMAEFAQDPAYSVDAPSAPRATPSAADAARRADADLRT